MKHLLFAIFTLSGFVFASQGSAKDMSDIDVGDRVCWTGWFSDSYGRVVSKDYSNDTVRLRLDDNKMTTAPASEIRNAGTCQLTRDIKDEGWGLVIDVLTAPSPDSNQ